MTNRKSSTKIMNFGSIRELDLGGFASSHLFREDNDASPANFRLEDDDSISSGHHEEGDIPLMRILTFLQADVIEIDVMFKLAYGSKTGIPENFLPKQPNVYNFTELFYNIKYPNEKKIFGHHFAGVNPRVIFDYIKYPDKATIKKYLKEGNLTSSTLRGSSHRKFKREITNQESSIRPQVSEIALLRSQILSRMEEINQKFDSFCFKNLSTKYVYKNKIKEDLN